MNQLECECGLGIPKDAVEKIYISKGDNKWACPICDKVIKLKP